MKNDLYRNQTVPVVEMMGVCFEGSREPGPGQNVAFPGLCRVGDGSILMVRRTGPEKNSAVGEMRLARSVDEGKTWREIGFDARNPEGKKADFRPASISDIGGGRLAMMLTWVDHRDGSSVLVNPKTEGLLPIRIGWVTSVDMGESWSDIAEIPVKPMVQPAGNCPILRLADGRLLTAFETYKEYDDPSPWAAKSCVVTSGDDGKTWSAGLAVAEDRAKKVSYYDPHVYVISDGSLMCLMWADDRDRPGESEIFRARSKDGGRTWTRAEPIGITGQFSALHRLEDGRWLMLYVVRGTDAAIRMAVGTPDGGKWQTGPEWVFYSQKVDDLAASKGKDYSDYLAGMGQWSFGWPAMVGLKDGGVLAGYYAGKGDRTSVFLGRIRGW